MHSVWKQRTKNKAPETVALWAEELCITPWFANLLWQRGLQKREAMDTFLSPLLRHLHQPEAVYGLSKASELLTQKLIQGEPMLVWGDYDVDGVTSTTLIQSFLNQRGYTVATHIPSRKTEGYGLSSQKIKELAQKGIKVLLTVDCGISDTKEIALAKAHGITVVVADHHLPGKDLPCAAAIVNPRMGDSPCPHLAAVGVSFFLMAAINRLLPGKPVDMRQFLDLVALGTVADVVRLTDQNRILVKNGLLVLKKAERPGVAALKKVSGYSPAASLGAGQVGFGLGPRINAAGRLDNADIALKLLLSQDHDTAKPLAQKLDTLNSKRRDEEKNILAEALVQTETQLDKPAFVLHAPHWHQGIIGIVASRVVEAHYRPTIILSGTETLTGSGRSIREFDIYTGLTHCAQILTRFGGHRMAAGMSLHSKNLSLFQELFCQAVVNQCGDRFLSPTLILDGELSFQEIIPGLLKELELMQPFGPGNAEPVFSSLPVEVVRYKTFGENHVLLTLKEKSCDISLTAKAWGQAEKIGEYILGKTIQVAFSPRIDRYAGVDSIELRLKDWQLL